MSRDVVDAANELVQHEINNLVQNHVRKSTLNRLAVTGRCYNCEDDVEEGLFCDPDCRQDYDRRMIKRKRDGR